jgi:poly(hydroxyalkanoate) depolymerase family esterase
MAKGIAPAAAIAAWIVTAATLLGVTPASAASLVEISGFGQNPTNLRMHVYAPDTLAAPPPILVAIHYCTGTGPAFFSGTEFRTLADRYGFIVIYPSATRSGQCFDVSSAQALRRNGGSDPVGIMSMVTYVIQSYGANANRVYVTGASSGAMMTNVMVGNYPDVFKAGAAFMGVPHSCFATTDGSMWNSQCSSGQRIMTAQQWGDLARGAFPGYTGARPRMQLWHGTNDPTLQYPNFGEEIKQWTNVLGVSQTPSFTDMPQSGWTRTRYGGTGIGAPVEGISLSGAGHDLPRAGQAAMAIQFFGLDTGGPGPDTQAPSVPANLTAPSSTSSSISLAWSASTDNVGVTGYQVLRAPGASGGTFAQIATSPSNSFVNTGLAASTTFRYQVRAVDAAGNASAVSSAVTATTQTGGGGDTQPPSAPSNLTAPATTASSISLAWTASTDNTGVTGYQILRVPGTTGGTFTQIGTSSTNSFVNSGLTANTAFRYQVRAVDAAANVSAVSNTVTATTLTGGTPGGGCSVAATVQTQWQTGYVIEPARVTNTGSATINGWTVTFTLPAGHTVTGSWNTTLTVSGQTVTARNASHNGTVAAGGNTAFGFQVSRPNGNTQVPSGYACASP